jgi:hypothetical protein
MGDDMYQTDSEDGGGDTVRRGDAGGESGIT